MAQILLLTLKFTVIALVLGIGMSSTPADISYLFKRPGLLFRSLAAMYLVVPLVALIIVRIVELPPAVEAALLVLAVSAGGILLPKRLMEISESSYVLSLTFVSSLMAIVMVPAWLTLLSPYFGGNTDLQPRDVALILTKAFLLPLLIGLFVRWRAPEMGKRLAERILEIGGLVLSISFVVLLAMLRGKLLEAGWFALLVLAGMAFIALAIGHWMGGPEPDNRTVLAVCCATRHVGIAVIVAAALPGPGTAALIGAYLIASMAVSVPYLQWRKRSLAAKKT